MPLRPPFFALATLAACVDPAADGVQVAATLTPAAAVATVGTLTYTTEPAARTQVRYGHGDVELIRPLEHTGAVAHEEVLVGLPGNTEAWWRIDDEAGAELASGTWSTGPVPAISPPTVVGNDAGAWITTTLLGSVYAAVGLSPRGEVVWYHFDESGLEPVRARPLPDGTGVVYTRGDLGGPDSAASAVVTVSWDGATVVETPVPDLGQDFVVEGDGAVVALAAETRAGTDGESVLGNALVRVETDGTWARTWSTWDCFDPALHPSNDPQLGWTWANALDEADGDYLVGLRNLSSIVRVDGESGGCGPIVGGDASEYTMVGDTWRHAHQFHRWDDRLLVFDNDGADGKSRALELVLDDVQATATTTWTYVPDTGAASFVLGDVARLADGSTWVAFSLAGQMDRVAPDGSVDFRLNTALGTVFGYTTLADAPRP